MILQPIYEEITRSTRVYERLIPKRGSPKTAIFNLSGQELHTIEEGSPNGHNVESPSLIPNQP